MKESNRLILLRKQCARLERYISHMTTKNSAHPRYTADSGLAILECKLVDIEQQVLEELEFLEGLENQKPVKGAAYPSEMRGET